MQIWTQLLVRLISFVVKIFSPLHNPQHCLGNLYEYLGDKRRFIAETRRILLDHFTCLLEVIGTLKISQLLKSFSNIIQRHGRKVLIYKMTLNKTPPDEHPSILSEKLKDYEKGLLSILTSGLFKQCLPLTVADAYVLHSIRDKFEKLSNTKSSTFCKELLPIETVKISKNSSRVRVESRSLPKSKISNHGNKTFAPPPPIVVNNFSESHSKVFNPSLEAESENSRSNYHQSMKEKLQRITAEVKNTKESMFLTTSQAIKRLFFRINIYN